MPTTVRELFNHINISNFKQISWGKPFTESKQGVYVIAISNNPDKHIGLSDQPNFDDQLINFWISKLSDFQVDEVPATLINIKERLQGFWLPDESILYIGKAPTRKSKSGISKRVTEYFLTIIGDGRPHSGGQWVKVLRDLSSFTVYYGSCDNPGIVENQMLNFFMSNVSKTSLENIYDKKLPIPFANIRYTGNKKHGLKNQRL